MKKFFRAFSVLVILGTIGLALPQSGHAEEEGGFWNWLKKVVGYPVKTTENVAHATGHAVENTGGIVGSEASNAGAVLSGDVAQTPELVTEPVQDTLNTAGQLLSETAGAPVKAAEDIQQDEAPSAEATPQ